MIPLPLINGTIRPDHSPFPMEFSSHELSLVLTTSGGKETKSKPINFTHVEHPFVVTAIEEHKLTVTWNMHNIWAGSQLNFLPTGRGLDKHTFWA